MARVLINNNGYKIDINTIKLKKLWQNKWSKSEKINSSILEYIKSNPKWKISLQTHKYLGVD